LIATAASGAADMQIDMLTATPRLRPFLEVVGRIGDKSHKSRKLNKDDDSYFVISLPKTLSYDEKMRRLSRLVDKVAAIEGRDMTCMVI
jgi:hypothetical protein